MNAISQSHFLQALGWAILNSFWQLGALWLFLRLLKLVLPLSAPQRYRLAVTTVVVGCIIFLLTALQYGEQLAVSGAIAFSVVSAKSLAPLTFTASFVYVILLLVPAGRWLHNMRGIRTIRRYHVQKGYVEQRLFVARVALQMGIKKQVQLFISTAVSSPVTVGFFKPVILLPFAVFNQLSTAQAEAILLHELAHIRRHDYLINLIISLVQTLFYFNPFMKLLADEVATEREICCDEKVLHFGYHPQGYAAALYLLGKAAVQQRLLIQAAGKQTLLHRIETILGQKPSATKSRSGFVAPLLAILAILLFNSVLIINDGQQVNLKEVYAASHLPVYLPDYPTNTTNSSRQVAPSSLPSYQTPVVTAEPVSEPLLEAEEVFEATIASPVWFDELETGLPPDAKRNIAGAVSGTKKYLTTVQWNQINKALGDLLTPKEKSLVKKEYLRELAAINWRNMEQNLKANYEQLDWPRINADLKATMTTVALDSIQQNVAAVLAQLDGEKQSRRKATVKEVIVPDASVETLDSLQAELHKSARMLDKMKPKKIIRL